MTTNRSGKAAVLGGGIGGLTAATVLIRRGWHVDVFERSSDLPQTGTALGLWPEALDALGAAGLAGAAESRGVLPTAGTIRRWDGTVIARSENIRRSGRLLSRPALLRLLAAGLPTGTIHFGRAAPPPSSTGSASWSPPPCRRPGAGPGGT